MKSGKLWVEIMVLQLFRRIFDSLVDLHSAFFHKIFFDVAPIKITTGKCSQSIVNDGGDLVTKLCPTLRDLMDCSLPGSSVHGIFQARILEWVAISISRGSS